MATLGNVAGALSLAYQGLLTLIGWLQIPAGQPVAIHFTGTDLRPDSFASKAVALLAIPMVTVLVFGLRRVTRPRTTTPARPGYGGVDIFIAVILAAAHSLIVFRAL